TRQVVAGLKAFIQKENILGKSVVIVCNLKPAKLRGVESNGMMLAADDGKKVVLLDAPESDPGDEVTVEGVPNKELFDQISIEEFSKLSFMVNDEGNIVCKNFKKKLKSPLEYIIAKGISTGAKVR
ncbi:methionine--tRNA ligase, partial [Candidatus Woesearchaeota archaeon]|nr:methionine--tRNA ligase [Candidatus Woesearchaeota archaeon]